MVSVLVGYDFLWFHAVLVDHISYGFSIHVTHMLLFPKIQTHFQHLC